MGDMASINTEHQTVYLHESVEYESAHECMHVYRYVGFYYKYTRGYKCGNLIKCAAVFRDKRQNWCACYYLLHF